MAIQTINLAVPGGDTPRSANTKINANFADQANAASRLVGTAAGQIPLAQDTFKAANTLVSPVYSSEQSALMDLNSRPAGDVSMLWRASVANTPPQLANNFILVHTKQIGQYDNSRPVFLQEAWAANSYGYVYRYKNITGVYTPWQRNYTDQNTTKDANGFLKAASPVADLYDDKMDLNHDATEQGGITFEKLGVGDYLVKGSLGFAQEGWYIETPKDANGNVLVAVVYKQLTNNDISIKTYAKRFDDETGDIVPNLTRPRDIPEGRFISLRLHELPQEPTVMPTQETSADAPAQTNNP